MVKGTIFSDNSDDVALKNNGASNLCWGLFVGALFFMGVEHSKDTIKHAGEKSSSTPDKVCSGGKLIDPKDTKAVQQAKINIKRGQDFSI